MTFWLSQVCLLFPLDVRNMRIITFNFFHPPPLEGQVLHDEIKRNTFTLIPSLPFYDIVTNPVDLLNLWKSDNLENGVTEVSDITVISLASHLVKCGEEVFWSLNIQRLLRLSWLILLVSCLRKVK